MGEKFYFRYLNAVLQERIQRNDKLNKLAFAGDFAITISPGGRVTAVTVLKSTGREDRDEQLRAALLAV
ncbi:energy transducer TonB, partial [Acinetobacter baumannii]